MTEKFFVLEIEETLKDRNECIFIIRQANKCVF